MERTQDEFEFEERLKTLSPQQRKIADLVVAGLNSKEIGHSLGISHRTVELHRGSILKRTLCANMFDLCYRMARFDIRREIQAAQIPAESHTEHSEIMREVTGHSGLDR